MVGCEILGTEQGGNVSSCQTVTGGEDVWKPRAILNMMRSCFTIKVNSLAALRRLSSVKKAQFVNEIRVDIFTVVNVNRELCAELFSVT